MMKKVRKSHCMDEEIYSKFMDAIPVNLMIASMNSMLSDLSRKGVEIYDFDNKNKTVKEIRKIGSKVYFLATEVSEHELKR